MLKYRLSTPARQALTTLGVSSLLALVVFFAAMMATAQALTITNRGTSAQVVTVMEGDVSTIMTVEPNQSIEPQCSDGCIVKNDNGDEMEFEGTETVLLDEEGFYFD